MNATTYMQMMPTQVTQGQSARSIFGNTNGQAVSGDAFAMLFMQLLGENGEMALGNLLTSIMSGQEDDPALMALLAGGNPGLSVLSRESDSLENYLPLMQNLRRQTEQDGVNNAMEMIAEILATMQMTPQDIQPEPEEIAVMQGQLSVAFPEGLPLNETYLYELPTNGRENEYSAVVSFEQMMTEAGVATDSPPAGVPMSVEQMRYNSAIQQVQRNLKDANKAEEIENIDIEVLQADVTRGRFMPKASEIKTELPLPGSAENVVEQVKTGILDNLGNKDAFVIKLKPEGLGEITIKMADREGKIVLSIQTTNSQVTRLLSDEVASLQNALRPLQAEVQEIVTATDYAAAAGGQFAGTGQRFGDERQYGGQTQSDQSYYAYNHSTEPAVESIRSTLLPDSALDAYI